MTERVEEYRYISTPGTDFRDLPINIVTLRVATFQKVHKRLTAPSNGAAGTPPKLGRRLSR